MKPDPRIDAAPGRAAIVLVAMSGAALLALAWWGEPLRGLLRWDRAALAAGEAWRLVTGHFVHLDLEHALLNVAGLALVAWLFAAAFSPRQWLVITLAGIAAIDVGLWWVNVDLMWYVGLSGVLHAAMAAGIVRRMIERDLVAWGLAVVGVAKLLYEHFSGALPLTTAGVPVITDAHLYGAVAGMACGLWFTLRGSRRGAWRAG